MARSGFSSRPCWARIVISLLMIEGKPDLQRYDYQGNPIPALIAFATWEVLGRFSTNVSVLAVILWMRLLTGIPLIAVHVKLIGTRRRFDMLICFNRVYPGGPARSLPRVGPAAVRLQDSTQPENPRRNLHIYKGNVLTEEEWPIGMRCSKKLVDTILELLCIFDLPVLILLLQDAIKIRYNMPIDLRN